MEANNKFSISKYKDGFLVSLHKSFYSKPAVFSAAYKFTGENIVEVFPIGENSVAVFMRPKDGKTIEDLESDVKLFLNEVLDQQVRVNLEREFGHIRDIIVEYAFSPIKKNNQ